MTSLGGAGLRFLLGATARGGTLPRISPMPDLDSLPITAFLVHGNLYLSRNTDAIAAADSPSAASALAVSSAPRSSQIVVIAHERSLSSRSQSG